MSEMLFCGGVAFSWYEALEEEQASLGRFATHPNMQCWRKHRSVCSSLVAWAWASILCVERRTKAKGCLGLWAFEPCWTSKPSPAVRRQSLCARYTWPLRPFPCPTLSSIRVFWSHKFFLANTSGVNQLLHFKSHSHGYKTVDADTPVDAHTQETSQTCSGQPTMVCNVYMPARWWFSLASILTSQPVIANPS